MRRALAAMLAAALIAPGAGAAASHRKKHAAPRVHHDERVSSPSSSGPPPHHLPPPGPPGPSPTPQPKPLGHLQVTAREYSLTLSRSALTAGRVAIELDNFGQDPHDLQVERTDGGSPAFSFTLAKPRTVSTRQFELGPGTWKLYCSLPGHEALGMQATVTVAG